MSRHAAPPAHRFTLLRAAASWAAQRAEAAVTALEEWDPERDAWEACHGGPFPTRADLDDWQPVDGWEVTA